MPTHPASASRMSKNLSTCSVGDASRVGIATNQGETLFLSVSSADARRVAHGTG